MELPWLEPVPLLKQSKPWLSRHIVAIKFLSLYMHYVEKITFILSLPNQSISTDQSVKPQF